jgi:transcriptional regulator with XRE-family HTH domain
MAFFGPKFGRLVRDKRGIEQLSQDDLAGKTGLTKARISQLETGRIRNPQAKTVDALCVALAISQEERAACHVPPIDSLPSRLLAGASPSSHDDFFWPLDPPTSMDRQMLHRRLGGPHDGLISISETSRNVLVFCAHVSWQYGDLSVGWKRDGCCHVMGEAQPEGEPLSGRNLLLLEAAKQDYTVRVFTGTDCNFVDYQGGFILDAARPYYRGDPYEEGGRFLQITYFRLRPRENVNRPTHLYRFFSLGQPDGKDPYPYTVP